MLLAYVMKMVHFALDEPESLKGYLLGALREEGAKDHLLFGDMSLFSPQSRSLNLKKPVVIGTF